MLQFIYHFRQPGLKPYRRQLLGTKSRSRRNLKIDSKVMKVSLFVDFIQKNIKASPLLDTDLNKKMKTFTEQNIATASEFAQKASNAKDFQDFWRIQTEFIQVRWKAFAEQTKELSEAATKSATSVMKGSST